MQADDFTEQEEDNGAHLRTSQNRDKTTACISMDRGIAVPTEGGGGGAFAEKSTMGLAFEMAAVVLNSACASSSFSDMLLVGCFHYHVCQPAAYL